jgi:hypothetical protein
LLSSTAELIHSHHGKDEGYYYKGDYTSTTRGGTKLPSRPIFSPTNATPAIKNKSAALHSLPLSKMSMPTEYDNELLDDSMDDEVRNESSNPSSNSELDRETTRDNAFKALLPESYCCLW